MEVCQPLSGRFLTGPTAADLAAGILIMYLTTLI
jgi:hypothetical protein